MDKVLWYLKGCSLFEQLSADEIEHLESRSRVRAFPRGATIYAPTEASESLLVLVQGRVKIKDITAEGKEAILAFIEEGEVFGELALLDGQRRQEYAQTVTEATVLLLPRDEVLALMQRRPDLSLSITKLIGLRRQRIENRLRNVLFLPSRERMLRLLLDLLDAHGDPDGQIRLPLSHQELASLIGVTRETVTTILGKFQRHGLVTVRRRRITVPDRKRLVDALAADHERAQSRRRPTQKKNDV